MSANEVVENSDDSTAATPKLARRLGLFDATMIVMGGIIGSGIFINPYVVARQVHTPFLILGAWLMGGLIALVGAFVYAELADRYPGVGGQYAYLREAYHPSVAFIYGWALLLVTQTGGMAAVAVTFSHYFLEITRLPVADWLVAALALASLTLVNCLGVRAGSNVQNGLMVLKILAVVALVTCGLFFVSEPQGAIGPALDRPISLSLLTAMGAAMTPVMFAYGGWQTASFVAGEMRDPRRDLARGLLIGVGGVILLYMAVNFVCLYVLGQDGLAETTTPASAVMRIAFGERGAALIAVGIAISTLGFLSQGMLTAPRVYFAMAQDRLFFKSIAWLSPRTRVPVLAIALQGVFAIVIALSGKYEQILNYVVSVDFIWFGLTAASLFVFRHRAAKAQDVNGRGMIEDGDSELEHTSQEVGGKSIKASNAGYCVPGHPLTTVLFVAACALIVLSTVYNYPANSVIGMMIVVVGIPVYFFWRWWRPQ
ncbi:MAG: amino acid permease [Acidobacteriota bacterium]|nr:amino acid permease [Acidobacteriota bacterium]